MCFTIIVAQKRTYAEYKKILGGIISYMQLPKVI